MKSLIFAKRNAKEILRDPLNLFFGIALPVILLLVLNLIGKNAPVSLFKPEILTPGMTVFSQSFITLFAALTVSKDRESAFLQRLYTSPMKAYDFIAGYILPFIPVAVIQSAACFAASLLMGLEFSPRMFLCILCSVPVSLFFTSTGILCGSLMGSKQAGGICGALFTNLCAFFSGIWIDVKLIGGAFEKIAEFMPFIHAADFIKAVYAGSFQPAAEDFIIILIYALVLFILSSVIFLRKMKTN